MFHPNIFSLGRFFRYLAVSAALLLAGCSSGGDPDTIVEPPFNPPAPAITSLSQNSAMPLSLLTLTGSGFDPNGTVTVRFSNGAGFSLDMPSGDVSGTGINVPIPPYFDPKEWDTWTIRAPMPTPRRDVAVGVINGIIYAVGGMDGSNGYLNTVEAYDPSSDSWTTKTPMPTARAGLAVEVIDGVLYAIGGNNKAGNDGYLAIVEAYDPATDTWTSKAPMLTARTELAAGGVDAKLYAVGGFGSALFLTTVEEYDPATDTWTTKAPMPTGRSGLAARVINGILYAVGGYQDIVHGLSTVEAYDPRSDTWTTRSPMPTARTGLATGVVNGMLYVVGGRDSSTFLATVEVYDPSTDSWTTKESTSSERYFLGAGVVNGTVYAVGGGNGTFLFGSGTQTNEVFTPSGVFTPGTVNIQVIQTSGGKTVRSNTVEGFQIQALPPAPSIPPGTLLLAFLNAGVQEYTDLQTRVSGTPLDTADMRSNLSMQISALQDLIAEVQAVIDGTNASLVIGQANGIEMRVGRSDLAVVDQLLITALNAVAGLQSPSATQGLSSAAVGANVIAADAVVLNPVQAAVQAILDLLDLRKNPVQPTVPQLTDAITKYSAAYAIYASEHPVEAAIQTATVVAITGAVLYAAWNAPTIILALQLQGFIVWGQLTEAITINTALKLIAKAIVKACADGPLAVAVGQARDVGKKFLLTGIADTMSRAIIGGISLVKDIYKCASQFVTYRLDVFKDGPGADLATVTGAGKYDAGETATVSFNISDVTAATFTSWTGPNADECGSGKVFMNADKSCTANFGKTAPPESNTITLSIAGTGSGSVTCIGNGVFVTVDCSGAIPNGTQVTLTATPDSGSTFTGWSGACSGTESCLVTMDGDKTVTATFVLSSNTPLSVTISGSYSFTPYDPCCPDFGTERIAWSGTMAGPVGTVLRAVLYGCVETGCPFLGTPVDSCGGWTLVDGRCRRDTGQPESSTWSTQRTSERASRGCIGTYGAEVFIGLERVFATTKIPC